MKNRILALAMFVAFATPVIAEDSVAATSETTVVAPVTTEAVTEVAAPQEEKVEAVADVTVDAAVEVEEVAQASIVDSAKAGFANAQAQVNAFANGVHSKAIAIVKDYPHAAIGGAFVGGIIAGIVAEYVRENVLFQDAQ